MTWTLDSDRPIYSQLVERIQMQIVSGQYPPGSRIPSVRDLAAEAAVNPNTMQKAFAELERIGLIITRRTNGRTVTEDSDMIQKIRQELAEEHLNHFIKKMRELDYDRASILELLNNSSEWENRL